MLEARNQAPLFVLELPVEALSLATGRASVLAIKRLLLARIDAAGNSAQQHQGSDLALQIVYKSEVVRCDCTQPVDACTITGEADALVHIRAADVRHFEDVMERIRAEPFVVRTRSVIVLSRLVDRDPGTDTLAPSR